MSAFLVNSIYFGIGIWKNLFIFSKFVMSKVQRSLILGVSEVLHVSIEENFISFSSTSQNERVSLKSGGSTGQLTDSECIISFLFRNIVIVLKYRVLFRASIGSFQMII